MPNALVALKLVYRQVSLGKWGMGMLDQWWMKAGLWSDINRSGQILIS